MEYNKAFIEKKGGMFNHIQSMTWNQSKFFLCDVAFTYSLIYFILPMYYARKRKWISTTAILILVFIAFQGLHYFFLYQMQMQNVRQRIAAGLPLPVSMRDNWERIRVVLFSATFNLTTMIGIAVAIKLMKRWWMKLKETEEFAREKARADLQLLKAQIHPHFLFNTLNNIYFFTLNASPLAPGMIKKLSGILHYILNECDHVLVPLEKELRMIQDYIALENIRYGEEMQLDVAINGNTKNKYIAPLLLIPFVENSFKHGASKMILHPAIRMNVIIEGDELVFFITNSKPLLQESTPRQAGLGLKNVKKRLQLLYPGRHKLNIVSEPESYAVLLRIFLSEIQISKTTTQQLQHPI
jgi:sensor histidine kinase YesM